MAFRNGVACHALAVAGIIDKYPKLNWIIGHMREGLPSMLARCEHQFSTDLSYLSRSLSKSITDQVTRRLRAFTNPPSAAALETFGIDRLLFSVDYASNKDGRAFLNNLPIPGADLEKFTHGNADRLLKFST